MKLFLALLFVCSSAFAQTSLPSPAPTQPGAADHIVTKNGGCIWWYSYLPAFTPANQRGYELNAYCANVAEFSKIGGRLATIVNAADPLKSLQTLPKRITMTRLRCVERCTADDPALAAVVAEMNAARGV